MRWVVILGCMFASGCLFENEISGSWNQGGAGGCARDHDIAIEVRDGAEVHVEEFVPCTDGSFAAGIPISVHHFWVTLTEINAGGGATVVYSSGTVEAINVTEDFYIGVVFLGPVPD